MKDLIKLINDKKAKYVDWDAKAQKIRNKFLEEYNADGLKKIMVSPEPVKKLISCGSNSKDYLLYYILNEKTVKACYGSADTTTSSTIVLYYDPKTKQFQYRKKAISETEANEKAVKIIQAMIDICEIVAKTTLTTCDEYIELEKNIINSLSDDIKNNFITYDQENKIYKIKTWFNKYLKLCFEEKFSSFYSENWTSFMCRKLEIGTKKLSPFVRNGAISLITNELVDKTGAPKTVVYRILLEVSIKKYKDETEDKTKDKSRDSDSEAEESTIEPTATEGTELPKQVIGERLNGYLGKNVIFYGVPGCGKSRAIKDLLGEMDEYYYKRILFHPEYSYGDFIGQIIPTLDKDNKPTYEFKEGPMLQMLKKAKDSKAQIFLIIEEINRGNAPAIFGDFFQLLDRGDDGKSEYSINNADVEKILGEGKVEIPSNLTILATMNTCDQNVFTLDTAFKRRFRMTRIPNSFEKVSLIIKFNDFKVEWKKLGPAINSAIIEKCNDGVSSEDKQLGAYFVHSKEDKIDAREFAEKVLMYLWDDVVKYDKQALFKSSYKTLDSLIEHFVKGENVFNDGCAEIKKIYEEIEVSKETATGADGADAKEPEESLED